MTDGTRASASAATGGSSNRRAGRGSDGTIFGVPFVLIVLLVCAVITHVVLHSTKLGRYTYAIGSNELGGLGADICQEQVPMRKPAVVMVVVEYLTAHGDDRRACHRWPYRA